MKNLNLGLILVIAIIAAAMQWHGMRNFARETDLREELASLEMKETKRHSSADSGNSTTSRTKRSSRSEDETARSRKSTDSVDPLDFHQRFYLSIENGDLAEATRVFLIIPEDYPKGWKPRWALNKLSEAVATHEDRRLVLEVAGKSEDSQKFLELSQALAGQSTFEANLDLLARAHLSPEKHDLAAAAIAGGKIDDDTPKRAEWLLKSLKTDQTEPVTHFAKTWTEGDFRAANTWVESLPHGKTRDAAVAGFSTVLARVDGASAVDWALSITDPAQREATLESVSKTWIDREPDAAAYLRDKGIEELGK